MKAFTKSDVTRGDTDFPRIYVTTDELIDSPLSWQNRGLQETASGYGAKLTSRYKIHFAGKAYRIYHTIYGNAGSAWFKVSGRKIYVS